MKPYLEIIGGIVAALLLFGLLCVVGPALISAKSTIAVIAGIVIYASFVVGMVVFAIKQFIKSNNEEN